MASSDGVVPSLAELLALRGLAQGRRMAKRGRLGVSGHALVAARGRGMEYAESREYAIGDDARHIDWRLTARSGRPHTKLFQAERERLTLIVADTAPSLYFGTRVRFKSVQAARAGAIAAWTALRDGDRIAALRGSDKEAPVPPAAGSRGVLRVLDALVRWYSERPAEDAGLATALDHAARVLRPGSRLVVLADPAQHRGHRRTALAGIGRAPRSHRAAADRSARTRSAEGGTAIRDRRPSCRARPRQRLPTATLAQRIRAPARSRAGAIAGARRARTDAGQRRAQRRLAAGARQGAGERGVMPADTLVLRDIHQPPAPPWWPPAPGWWLVAAVLLIVLAVGWWLAARRRPPTRDRGPVRCSTVPPHHRPRRRLRRCRNCCDAQPGVAIRRRIVTKAMRGCVSWMPTASGRSFPPRSEGCCWKVASDARSMQPPSLRCGRSHGSAIWPGCRDDESGRSGSLGALFANFAWPLWLCALPLPLLARWLLPPRRNAAAALKVPYGARIDAIAAAGGHSVRGRGPGVFAWLAWALLCLAAARPQQLGHADHAAAGRPRPDARRGPVRQHGRAGHGTRRQHRRSPHCGEGGTRRLPRSSCRRSRRPAGVRRTCLHADAVDAGPHHGARPARRQRGRPRRPRDRDRRCDRPGGQAPAQPAGRAARADPVDRRGQHRRRTRRRTRRPNWPRPNTCACTRSRSAAKAARCRCSASACRCPAAARTSTRLACSASPQQTGGRFFRARDTESLAGIYAEIDRLEPVQRPGTSGAAAHRALSVATAGVAGAAHCWPSHGRCGGSHEHVAAALPSPRCISSGRNGCGRCWHCRCWVVVAVAATTRKRMARAGRSAPAAAPARGRQRPPHACGAGWRLLACALAVLALAGPAWRQVEQPLWQTRAPLVIALDLSSASAGERPAAIAIAAGARQAGDVAARAQGGQVALVAYAGDAFTVAPLTDDAGNVALFLDVLAPDVMPVDGQRADRAIAWSMRLLRPGRCERGDILLLSDHADAAAHACRGQCGARRLSGIGVGPRHGSGRAVSRSRWSNRPARLDAASLRTLAATAMAATRR